MRTSFGYCSPCIVATTVFELVSMTESVLPVVFATTTYLPSGVTARPCG